MRLRTNAEASAGRITGSITMGKGQNRSMVALVHHIHLVRRLLPGHMQCTLWSRGSKLSMAVLEGGIHIFQSSPNISYAGRREPVTAGVAVPVRDPCHPSSVNAVNGSGGDLTIQCSR